MRVIDASVAIEWVLPPRDGAVERRASIASGESLHSPEIIDLEVANVLRRLVSSRRLESRAAATALDLFLGLDIERYAHRPLIDRIWRMSGNVSAYDAAYVALAAALGCPVVTKDAKLARAASAAVPVELLDRI